MMVFIKVLAVLLLVLLLVFGSLIYLTRVDFEPVPLAGPSTPLRAGAYVLSVPPPLEVKGYRVELKLGASTIYLNENLEGPPDVLADGLVVLEVKRGERRYDDPELVTVVDVTEDLGRAASLEVKWWSLWPKGEGPADLSLQVIMPLPEGFLAFNNWVGLPQESQDRLDQIIDEEKDRFIAQVKSVLPHYQWLGSEIGPKPAGFRTRYGSLNSVPGAFQASSQVDLGWRGEPSSGLRYVIHARQTPKSAPPAPQSAPRPPLLNEIKMLFQYFRPSPVKFHTKLHHLGEMPGYETVIFSFNRVKGFDDSTFMMMEWTKNPEADGAAAIYMSFDFLADGFNQARAPEFFTLWRHLLDNAR